MKIILAILITMMLSACAHKPGVGSLADATTTYVGLNSGLVEVNPVVNWAGDPLAMVGLTLVVKQVIKYAMTPLVGKCAADWGVEVTGSAAAGWNLGLIITGLWAPSLVMAAGGAWLYHNYADDKYCIPQIEDTPSNE